MLNRLRCRDEGCIENGLVLDFTSDIVGFLNDAVDCWVAHVLRFQFGKWDTCCSRFTWFSVSRR